MTVATQTGLVARQMTYLDLPDVLKLGTGMENYTNIDPDWVWVAEADGELVAALFGAPAHGAALLLRVWSKGPNYLLVPLLRKVLECLRERGFRVFISFLSAESASELKLARIAQRYGAQLVPFSGYVVAGRVREDFV